MVESRRGQPCDAKKPSSPEAGLRLVPYMRASSMFGHAASHRCFVCALHSSSSVAHNLREPQQPLLDRRVTLGVGPH